MCTILGETGRARGENAGLEQKWHGSSSCIRQSGRAILGDRRWPQTAKRVGGIRLYEGSRVVYGRNVMSTSMLEVYLLGVGTVLRLERDAWSMVKRLRQATK